MSMCEEKKENCCGQKENGCCEEKTKFDRINETLASVAKDYAAFWLGNKQAGVRVRKAMLVIKDLALDIRKEVLEIRNPK